MSEENKIIFKNKEHEDFFYKTLKRFKKVDEYRGALIYCLGLSEDTRNHIDDIFHFDTNCVNPFCLESGWVTSGSAKILRLAFNLYTDEISSLCTIEEKYRLAECKMYSVSNLFCTSDAPYFWQAIKIRYPEYTN